MSARAKAPLKRARQSPKRTAEKEPPLRDLTDAEADALASWMKTHGAAWKDTLIAAWHRAAVAVCGPYLYALRNSHGPEWLERYTGESGATAPITAPVLHKCAAAHCPGYPYKASDMAHPCRSSRFAAPDPVLRTGYSRPITISIPIEMLDALDRLCDPVTTRGDLVRRALLEWLARGEAVASRDGKVAP